MVGNTVERALSGVSMHWGVKIPMRDGTRLSATLYLPEKSGAAAPCLFNLTPYTGNRNHPRACLFAQHGYPVLVVDARGRGNSEGTFAPYIHEAKDGFDVVEWISAQPFCNGQVAMFGGSYEGRVQWEIAKEFPPHLVTIVPSAAPAPAVEFPMRNNITYPYLMRWVTLTSGHSPQTSIFEDQRFWKNQYHKWYVSGRPLRDLDSMVGNPSEIFQTWISHPEQGPYWDAYLPTAEDYTLLNLPILTVTGAYDSGQLGSLHQYRQHHFYGDPEAVGKHYLVIGPWDHRGMWNGSLGIKPTVGGLQFGPDSLIDTVGLHIDWYNWTMRGGQRPALLQKRVSYYVAGAEKWRYAGTLEGVTAVSKPLYLDSTGVASQIFSSGSLRDSVGQGLADTYIYDPKDISIAEVESSLDDPFTILRPVFPTDDPTDQTVVYAREGKALFYHSAPFYEDTELTGFFRLVAWISIDQPDTDFLVTVYEITRDGHSILLTSDIMRARYRESLREQKLVQSTEPLQYEFNRFTFISRQVKAGGRLRLVIGPINSIYFQRNCNSGGAVADESIHDARPVRVTLWHDPDRPSALYVPYGQPVADDDPITPDAAFAKMTSVGVL